MDDTSVLSIRGSAACVKVVKIKGCVCRMVLAWAVISGYIFASSWTEYATGAVDLSFSKSSFAGALSAVNFSRVILKKNLSLSQCRP